jgi:hypothetical protein
LHYATKEIGISLPSCGIVLRQHRSRNQIARRGEGHCSDDSTLTSTTLEANDAAPIGRLRPGYDSDACQLGEASPCLQTSWAVMVSRDDDGSHRRLANAPQELEYEALGFRDRGSVVEDVARHEEQIYIFSGHEVRQTPQHGFEFVEASQVLPESPGVPVTCVDYSHSGALWA